MAQLIDTATPTPARIEPPAAEPLPDDETAAIAAFSLVAAAHADHYAPHSSPHFPWDIKESGDHRADSG
jgi:hypothetical protein